MKMKNLNMLPNLTLPSQREIGEGDSGKFKMQMNNAVKIADIK